MRSEFDYSSYNERECSIHNHAFYLGEQHQQSKVDELTLQVAEMKSRLNDAYTDGQSAMYTARQTEVDELQKQLIEQGQRLNVQTQQIASLKWQLKRLGYTDNGGELMKPPIGDAPKFDLLDELQKRVDSAYMIISQLNNLDDEAWKRWKREACMFSQGESNAYEHAVRLLEQALKGEQP